MSKSLFLTVQMSAIITKVNLFVNENSLSFLFLLTIKKRVDRFMLQKLIFVSEKKFPLACIQKPVFVLCPKVPVAVSAMEKVVTRWLLAFKFPTFSEYFWLWWEKNRKETKMCLKCLIFLCYFLLRLWNSDDDITSGCDSWAIGCGCGRCMVLPLACGSNCILP